MEFTFFRKRGSGYYQDAILVSVILGLLFWLSETFIDTYIFHSGSFLSRLFPVDDENELWMRFLMLISLFFSGFSVVYFLEEKITTLNISKLTYRILSGMGAAALVTDHENKIIFINQRYTEITGYSLDEIIGKNPRVLGSGMQDKTFYHQMWNKLNTNGCWEGEVWNRKKTGELCD